MANTAMITKDNLLTDCRTFGTGKTSIDSGRCKACKAKFKAQFDACVSAAAALVKGKAKGKGKTEKPARVVGFWGYAKGSFTDIFCESICLQPLTMNQVCAIIDPKTKQPIGPHPKAKARLIAEKLAATEGHLIYMRVYPKGHPKATQLTPAAKIIAEAKAKAKTEAKTEAKTA